MAPFFRTYRVQQDGQRINGVFTMAFIHNLNYYLTHISIYQDGMIDCWELVDFEEFKRKVRSGWVVTQLTKKTRINVSNFASFTAIDASYWVEPEEFIKEVADEIEALNGRPTTSDQCREAWEAYQRDPSEAAKESVRSAYEAIPQHLRRSVLRNMDTKDGPIREVLYPDECKRRRQELVREWARIRQRELSWGRVWAVLSLLLCWLPLIGLVAGVLAYWLNRRSTNWTYRTSLVGLTASGLVHATVASMLIVDKMRW